MEIVNIEAETFREMLSAWNSLKSKLEELQDVCLKKASDEWLECREVCGILGISSRTLQYMRSNGTLTFTRIDGKVLYRKGYRVIIENRTKEKINYGKDYYPDK